jgi:hypothetical protein
MERAKAALGAGYTAVEIAKNVFPAMQSWRGNESDYWQTWIDAITPFLGTPDP